MPVGPASPGLPPSHRIARRFASAGLRGASWYWRLARLAWPDPEPGVVVLPDGTPIVHDPDDWTYRGSYEGTYEREILRLLPNLVLHGDVVVDVGANVGILTARLSRLVGPTGLVIAVEPSPRCVDDLRWVLEGMSNVTLVQAALGATKGTVSFTGWDNPDHRGLGTAVPGHRAGLEENWHDGATIEVPQRRLDEVLAEFVDDGEIGLLKVDVEGYEADVLNGAPDLFRSGRVRAAIMEVTPGLDADWVGDLISDSIGYRAFAICERGQILRRTDLQPVGASEAVSRSEQWNLLLQRDV